MRTASLVVLIIDDDPFCLTTLQQQLDAIGVTNVICASDGAHALDVLRLRSGDVDLVICDISMPEADGFSVLEDITETGFDGKLLFVSGMDSGARDMLKLVADAHSVNVLDVLEKPLSSQQLQGVVSATAA